MKRLGISALFLFVALSGVNAAVPQQRRGTATTAAQTATTTQTQGATSSARSAVSARSAARTPATGTATTATRAATAGKTTVARGNTATSAAPASAARSATVSARAGATQKVISTGTKVATAAQNIVVSEACQQKYDGCMDSFCMIENASGGRCICSDRNKELNSVLEEIEKLDQQSYQMATVGVEKIEMGSDAEQAIANANAVAQSVINNQNNEKQTTTRRSLDLSLWDIQANFDDDDDIFASGELNAIEGKEGDALHRAANDICVAMIPECSAEKSMLQMMYAQRIKSDCTAYENNLKQQKNSSQQKLYAAEKALRDAALDQLRTANKYDLGQCTVEFKKCMATTGGCGDDFKGCVGIAAAENAKKGYGSKSSMKMYDIQGSATKISIAASSYDALESKKPLCISVTNSCVAVKDQVWDTFLREVAPQIKTAELLAESDLRTSCIGNISACFQKACKDTMDPNDPDGSYDMCLSRPETVKSLCKVQIDPCVSAEPLILDYVYARLAAMRVDSCTTEVKECLQSDDRCGKDYSNCIGLDFNAIKQMCPKEKLLGCQKDGQPASDDELNAILQGVYLSIDNALLEQCQDAVNAKMIEVCGDTLTCPAFESDSFIGTESLTSYTNSDGDIVIDGLISFGNIIISDSVSSSENRKFSPYEINVSDYQSHLNDTDPTAQRIVSALESVSAKINQKISLLSTDSTIKMCIEGRDLSQATGSTRAGRNIKTNDGESLTAARFPHLLDASMLAVINSALDQARYNYNKKYNTLIEAATEQQNDTIKAVLCAAIASSDAPMCVEYSTTEGNAICSKYEPSSTPFDNVFNDSTGKGMQTGADMYSTQYVLTGAKLSTLAAVQQSGHSEHTQVDEHGNMIGKIVMNSVYSSSNNTCTVTTITTMCSDMEQLVTKNTYKESCGSGGISLFGSNGCGRNGLLNIGGGGKSKTITTETYHGVTCKNFAEPITDIQQIKM
ncbi:MAG: hypothetical protein K2I81_00170 [Alphaproteobacteria bacterium]|nr:hypothetical protein [Alphaproteobacteria bacterium]